MGKRTRIVLYALSLVTMLAMVTLIIFSHGRQSGEPAKDVLSETDISSTEEPVQIPEAEEPEETEAADGQNGIQNDTEQEEVDIADDTTLIFAGDVLFANAFKSNYDAGGIEKVIEPQLRQGKDILIVGHGVMNASIVCQIKDIPVKDFWSVKMKNAELVRLL